MAMPLRRAQARSQGTTPGLHRKLELVARRRLEGGADAPLQRGGGGCRTMLRVDADLVLAQHMRREGSEGLAAEL
jgi:hypothetical protein